MSDQDAIRPGEELDEEVEQQRGEVAERELLTDDARLVFGDAEDIAADRGVAVVLVIGEVASGKTSLLVAIWNALLGDGHIGNVLFAGTRTALGFERRAWLTRFASQSASFSTVRTYQHDDGFLHLRLRDRDRTGELLLSDLAGETFERIRKGATMSEVLPWSEHVDKAVVLVDGASLIDPARRSTALSHARAQLRHLHADLSTETMRVAVVLTMSDMLRARDEERRRWKREAQTLLGLARDIDPDAVTIETSARRGSGLGQLARWLLEQPPSSPPATGPPLQPPATRAIGRLA